MNLDAINQRRQRQLDRLVDSIARTDVLLREATLDVFGSLNLTSQRDLLFQISDDDAAPAMASLQPPWYQQNVKRGEVLPVYQTEQQLRYIRDRSRILCFYNEFALCAIENRVNYVVGEDGLTFAAAPADPNDGESRRAARLVQEFLDLWVEVNDLADVVAETLRRTDEDGEAFLRLFPDSDGFSRLRFIEPEHVRARGGDQWPAEYSFGVQTEPGDVEEVVKYWVVDDPLADGWESAPVDEADVVHFKANVKRASKRGLPTFFPVEQNLRRCEDLLASLTSMAKTRAKIALIRKLTGTVSDTAANLLKQLTAVQVTDPATSEQLNVERLRYGTILTASGNTDYQYPYPEIGASDFVEVLQAELRAVAARLQMSEWMFTALADAKYSNAFVVEAPTLRAFKRIQKYLIRKFASNRYGCARSVAWRAVMFAVDAGLLPKKVIDLVRIDATGPSLETRDKSAEATTNKTYVEMRVKSPQTIQKELSLDPDEEARQWAEWDAREKVGQRKDLVQQVVAIQEAFYAGQLPRAAAGAVLGTLGFTREEQEALLPLADGVDRTAAGKLQKQQAEQQQQMMGAAGGSPQPGGSGESAGSAGDGNPFAALLGGTGGMGGNGPTPTQAPTGQAPAGGLSEQLREQAEVLAVRTVDGRFVVTLREQMSDRFEARLREAGFTGTVVDNLGRTYYYVDGRRVKNPHKNLGPGETPKHAEHVHPTAAVEAKAKALALVKLATESPDAIKPEHLAELPKLLATVPKVKLELLANELGGYVSSGKLKAETVAAVAALFPMPKELEAKATPPEPTSAEQEYKQKVLADLNAEAKKLGLKPGEPYQIEYLDAIDDEGKISSTVALHAALESGQAEQVAVDGQPGIKFKHFGEGEAKPADATPAAATEKDSGDLAHEVKQYVNAYKAGELSDDTLLDMIEAPLHDAADPAAVAEAAGFDLDPSLAGADSAKVAQAIVDQVSKKPAAAEPAPTPAAPTPAGQPKYKTDPVGHIKDIADYAKANPGDLDHSTVKQEINNAFLHMAGDDIEKVYEGYGLSKDATLDELAAKIEAGEEPKQPGAASAAPEAPDKLSPAEHLHALMNKWKKQKKNFEYIAKGVEKFGKHLSPAEKAHLEGQLGHTLDAGTVKGKVNVLKQKLADLAAGAESEVAHAQPAAPESNTTQTTTQNPPAAESQPETPHTPTPPVAPDHAGFPTGQPVDPATAPPVSYAGKKVDQIPGWEGMASIPHDKRAFGAVVLRTDPATGKVQVLLREPANHFDGYVWTFPKGKQDAASQTPEEVAHKELGEETGYAGQVIGHLPTPFKSSGVTQNAFFVMKHDGGEQDPSKMDAETSAVKWVDLDKAHELLGQTTKASGKARDLAILDAVRKYAAGEGSALGQLTPVKKLGGSTGAELVKAPGGGLFVKKQGKSAGHVQEESTADSLYEILGADVPPHKLYDGPGGPTKLSKYVDGQTLGDYLKTATPQQKDAVYAQLRKHFVADALLGNWDVVGLKQDNVLVGKDGKVYRVDNGGALRYRAQGGLKSADDVGSVVKELDTLRDPQKNPQTAEVFKGITDAEIKHQIADVVARKDQLLAAVKDPLLRGQLRDRIDYLASWHSAADFGAAHLKVGQKLTPAHIAKLPKPSFAAHGGGLPPADAPRMTGKLNHDYGQFDAWHPGFTAQTAQWRSGVDAHPAQKHAFQHYTANGFSSINKALREGKTLTASQKDVVEKINQAWATAPRYKPPIVSYRGIGLSPSKAAQLLALAEEGHAKGLKLQMGGMQSTSINWDTAEKGFAGGAGHGVMLEVLTHQGPYLDRTSQNGPLSSVSGEGEILQPHNTVYRIHGVKTVKVVDRSTGEVRERKVIQVEQIPGEHDKPQTVVKTGGSGMESNKLVEQDGLQHVDPDFDMTPLTLEEKYKWNDYNDAMDAFKLVK